MYFYPLNLSITLALIFILISLLLFCFFRDWVKLLISLELLILFLVLLFASSSYILDDLIGALFALILLPIAGAETAIALFLLVLYSPQRRSILISISTPEIDNS